MKQVFMEFLLCVYGCYSGSRLHCLIKQTQTALTEGTTSEVTCASKKRKLSQTGLLNFHLTLPHLVESHISERKCCNKKKENKRQLQFFKDAET